jgi:hypothetical protein
LICFAIRFSHFNEALADFLAIFLQAETSGFCAEGPITIAIGITWDFSCMGLRIPPILPELLVWDVRKAANWVCPAPVERFSAFLLCRFIV